MRRASAQKAYLPRADDLFHRSIQGLRMVGLLGLPQILHIHLKYFGIHLLVGFFGDHALQDLGGGYFLPDLGLKLLLELGIAFETDGLAETNRRCFTGFDLSGQLAEGKKGGVGPLG